MLYICKPTRTQKNRLSITSIVKLWPCKLLVISWWSCDSKPCGRAGPNKGIPRIQGQSVTVIISLENFIPFEKCKRCTKRKYFVVWIVSHFIYNIVMRKRVKLNSYEPLVRDKNMRFVARSWYNKIFPFVKPFAGNKWYKNFQWKFKSLVTS